jgi:hypothetical protein
MNPKKKSRRCRASVSIQALDLAISRFIHSLALNWYHQYDKPYIPPSSVADPGCLSRILILPIPDPGSRILDPKTATKERGEKKFVVIPFYVATNFTKLNITLVLKC